MSIVIRERRAADLPELADVLAAQQAATGYPVRWPLPIPVEDFLVRPGEEQAWVAELEGRVVGHVAVYSLGGPLRDAFVEGAGTDALAELAVLFVGGDVVGTGVGGLLLDTAVASIRASGRQPVLDVVPTHDRALAIYLHRGWTVIGEAHVPFLGPDRPLVLMTLDADRTGTPGGGGGGGRGGHPRRRRRRGGGG
ncbi:GNAT family N-acetyltransferase, partial [Nocardioides mangrovi]